MAGPGCDGGVGRPPLRERASQLALRPGRQPQLAPHSEHFHIVAIRLACTVCWSTAASGRLQHGQIGLPIGESTRCGDVWSRRMPAVSAWTRVSSSYSARLHQGSAEFSCVESRSPAEIRPDAIA